MAGTRIENPVITRGGGSVLFEEIITEQYPNSDTCLIELSETQAVKDILSRRGMDIDVSSRVEGGSGIVYKCGNGSVVKIASLHHSYSAEMMKAGSYFDIRKKAETDEQKMQKAILTRLLEGEARINYSFDDKQCTQFQSPFVIAVFEGELIRDYLLCVNMPYYESIDRRFAAYNEKEILRMIRDVLSCLETAHTDGVRHRDIKPGNIMYDPENKKYVLIDWGASCAEASNDLAEEFFGAKINGDGHTPCFVDPERMIKEKEYDAETDLYSLGVIMAYLAHSKGFCAGNTAEKFREAVCPDARVNNMDIIAGDVYKMLANSSGPYREVVRKSMNHGGDGYKLASKMLEDIKDILEENGGKKYKEKPDNTKRINIHPWHGLIVAAFLFVYTFIISGKNGLGASFLAEGSVAMSVMWMVMCAIVPALVAVTKKTGGWAVVVRLSTIVIDAVAYVIITLASSFILKTVNECVTLDMNSITLLAVSGITALMLRIAKNVSCGSTLRAFIKYVVYGILTALGTGANIIACVYGGNITDAVQQSIIALVGAMTGLGIACGTAVWFVWWLNYTRITKPGK